MEMLFLSICGQFVSLEMVQQVWRPLDHQNARSKGGGLGSTQNLSTIQMGQRTTGQLGGRQEADHRQGQRSWQASSGHPNNPNGRQCGGVRDHGGPNGSNEGGQAKPERRGACLSQGERQGNGAHGGVPVPNVSLEMFDDVGRVMFCNLCGIVNAQMMRDGRPNPSIAWAACTGGPKWFWHTGIDPAEKLPTKTFPPPYLNGDVHTSDRYWGGGQQ